MTTKTQDVAAIRTEIEHTRHELGSTVQALAAKVDVKARARAATNSARTWTRAHRSTIAPAALAAAAVATALLILRRRRRR